MVKLAKSARDERDRVVRAYIKKNMALYDLSDEEVSIKLMCTKRTFQNKMKRPETFTLGELRELAIAIKFTDEEKSKII